MPVSVVGRALRRRLQVRFAALVFATRRIKGVTQDDNSYGSCDPGRACVGLTAVQSEHVSDRCVSLSNSHCHALLRRKLHTLGPFDPHSACVPYGHAYGRVHFPPSVGYYHRWSQPMLRYWPGLGGFQYNQL